jgi:glutamyl-tRNA reductase
MAEAIMKKLLHRPISRLKRVKDPEGDDLLAARRLFGLDDEDD